MAEQHKRALLATPKHPSIHCYSRSFHPQLCCAPASRHMGQWEVRRVVVAIVEITAFVVDNDNDNTGREGRGR